MQSHLSTFSQVVNSIDTVNIDSAVNIDVDINTNINANIKQPIINPQALTTESIQLFDANELNIAHIKSQLLHLQMDILITLQTYESKPFQKDVWTKPIDSPLQGEGFSCLVEQGSIFERGGCNFSHVKGEKLPIAASKRHPELAGLPFEAMGVSLVLHPHNPYIPTVHLNIRLMVVYPPNGDKPIYWFGGGMDLTPYYPYLEDVLHFHRTCKQVLDKFGVDKYPRFKHACDEYFYLPHRQEARGIGGIFFDDFLELGTQQSWAMTLSVGQAFLPAYLPILLVRKSHLFTQIQRDFQAYRRGRYVEFNLVLDRGTLFGLQSGGRTESILMSMPPTANWRYNWIPEPNSPEAVLYNDFLPRRDWLGCTQ